MKGIFKLFPVAAAMLMLASCSSDDLSVFNGTEKAPDNALRFTIESTTDGATRAGIVGTPVSKISQVRFKWTQGDVIRVYDNTMSEWNKFTYADGSFQDGTTFTPDAANNNDLTYNLAVYPADEVDAVYMDKNDKAVKHIEMTLPTVYNYEEKVDFADGTAGYRCDMPMYGNVTDVTTAMSGNQMNFLTAWTRIYLRDLPEDVKYIALVSENADQPLTGRFRANVAYNNGSVTNQPILAADADLRPTWGNVVYAEVNSTAWTADAAAKDSAAICFPFLAEQPYDKLTVYALTDGTTPIATLLTDADWQTEVLAGRAYEIASRNDIDNSDADHTFYRRNCWTVRYTEPLLVDVSAYSPLTPGKLGEIIATKANTAINELRVVLYASDPAKKNVLFSSEGYDWNHITTIPKMTKGANVTIDMSDPSMKLYKSENWKIDGSEFTGTLTIIQGEDADADIAGLTAVKTTAKIEVNLPNAKVKFVSGGAFNVHNMEIQQCDEFTLGDGVTATKIPSGYSLWVRDGKVKISKGANAAYLYAAKNELTGTGAEFINVYGGAQVTNLYVSTDTDIKGLGQGTDEARIHNIFLYTVRDGNYTRLADNIEIYTEGKAYIRSIYTRSAGAPTELKYVTITSKLLEQEAGVNAFAELGDEINSGTSTKTRIYTAAQLQKAATDGIANASFIMADVIDLNNLSWVGGTVTAAVSGYNHNAGTKTWKTGVGTGLDGTYPTATKKNVIKNISLAVQDKAGLFAEATSASFSGLELEGVTFSDDADTENKQIGALVGLLTPTADCAITNVKATGINFSGRMEKYVGGLVGQLAAGANFTIENAKVAATALKARAFVGGLIGGIKADVTKVDIKNTKANVSEFGLLLKSTSPTLYPSYAGTFASFIGGTEDNPMVAINIYNCDYGTAINKTTKGGGVNNQSLRFGANATSSDVPFFGGNPWIGFCGTLTGTSNTTLTTFKDINATEAWKYVYDTQKMTQSKVKVTDYATVVATTNYPYEWNGTTHATVNPNGYKYGTTIYNDYDTSALTPNFLGYDNVYQDKKEIAD